jgi:hypothetical protein
MNPLLALLEEVVAAVADEHFVNEGDLRARVAEKIAAGLRARGFDPDPEIEAAVADRWPLN